MPEHLPLTEEERILFRHVRDMAERGAGAPRFTAFLNEREQQVADAALKGNPLVALRYFGGYPEAQRKVLGISFSEETPDDFVFPIRAIAVKCGKNEKLSHCSVLGSLTSLGISRESIGDILPREGVCHLLALETVARVVLDELDRVGGFGVKAIPAEFGDLAPVQEFIPMRSTVSSLRIDCLVSMLTGLAREKSALLIKSGQVQLSYREQESGSAKFNPGDIISIRGYGKFIVDSVGAPTRKGRLPVACRKYV